MTCCKRAAGICLLVSWVDPKMVLTQNLGPGRNLENIDMYEELSQENKES
jgi:hypothetical protein